MSDNSSQQDSPVRVTGEQASIDDHPAHRKVARAVISMAMRGVTPTTVGSGSDATEAEQPDVHTEQPKGGHHG